MPELTFQNIEQVSREILKQEVSYSHLPDELVDHVCCDIEDEMLNGLSFSDAYNKVMLKIGPDRFRQIQKETLYAVDLKYRNMRNIMKISGIAGTFLFGTAALFRIQHWPLAGIIMTLGGIILTLGFLPSALAVLWKETRNRKRIFLFISGFLAGAFLIAGALFKSMHWPGAGIVITLSFLTGLFLFIPALLVSLLKDPERIKFRAVIIAAMAGIVLFNLGFLFRIQHWPFASVLIISGTVVIGFIALPWYTWLSWSKSEKVNPEFIFLLVACLAVIVPGILITLNLQESDQKTEIVSQEPNKQDKINLNEVK